MMVNICWNPIAWQALCCSAGMVHLFSTTASRRGACYYHCSCSKWGNWGQEKLSNLSNCRGRSLISGWWECRAQALPSVLRGRPAQNCSPPRMTATVELFGKFLSSLSISSPSMPWNFLQFRGGRWFSAGRPLLPSLSCLTVVRSVLFFPDDNSGIIYIMRAYYAFMS